MADGRTDRTEEWSSEEEALRVIDFTVEEIFQAMLRCSCQVAGKATGDGVDIAARISFSGALEGECIVALPRSTAARITEVLLGGEDDWSDAIIDDAVGELCNMIAGGWKSRLSHLQSMCRLSVPSVSRGGSTPARRLDRLYSFEGNLFEVGLRIRC